VHLLKILQNERIPYLCGTFVRRIFPRLSQTSGELNPDAGYDYRRASKKRLRLIIAHLGLRAFGP
jgi:hypothetical protein